MDNTIQPRTLGEEGKPQEDSESGGRRVSEVDEKESKGNSDPKKGTKSPDQERNKVKEAKEIPKNLRYKNPKKLKYKKYQKKRKSIKYQGDFKGVITISEEDTWDGKILESAFRYMVLIGVMIISSFVKLRDSCIRGIKGTFDRIREHGERTIRTISLTLEAVGQLESKGPRSFEGLGEGK